MEWLLKIFIPMSGQHLLSPDSQRILVVDGHGSHTTTEFMYECFKNRIYLLFLPPHSSHITQPLDLSCFSPLKAAYRRKLQEYEALVDCQAIGKSNFILIYAFSRKKALTPANILAGWRSSGLCPYSPRRALTNPMVPVPEALECPKTPQKPCKNKEIRWDTPQSSADLRRASAQLGQQEGVSDGARREIRRLFHKAAKALDNRIVQVVQADLRIRALDTQIQLLRPARRTRVAPDPNGKFVTIAAIKRAQEKAQILVALDNRASNDQEEEFQSMCTEFLLE